MTTTHHVIQTRRGVMARFAAGLLLAMAASGAWAQTLGISAGGTPTYSRQIAVPPGIAGMAPNIALLYSGGEVNGPLGRGWTLQGISSITRCQSNKITDGTARAVAFDANDKLCMDGQRLIQTDANGVVFNADNQNPTFENPFQQNDSRGGEGMVREYRTEKDIYARIRAYGAAGGDPANGPAYFRVWTKSGQLYEYGAAGDPRANAAINARGRPVIVSWAVSRIFDSVGNHMDFQYEQRDVAWGTNLERGGAATTPGHEWNLLEIRYTGHGAQLPANRMVFAYSDRPDAPNGAQDRGEAYHQGSKNVSIRRLDTIRTYINWPGDQVQQPSTAVGVKTVKLEYDHGAVSGRSRLRKIVECAGAAATPCLPAVSFNYAEGGGAQYQANAKFAASGLAGAQLHSSKGELGVLTGNFFATGRSDILRWSNTPSANQLYRSLGDGNFNPTPIGGGAGQFNLTDQYLFSSNGCYYAVALDFNGDGATDILRLMRAKDNNGGSCGAPRNVLFLSRGDGSFASQDVANVDFNQTAAVQSYTYRCDGDIPVRQPPVARRLPAVPRAPAAPDGSALSICNGGGYTTIYHQTQGATYHLLDVNGDGLLDVVSTIMPAYHDMESVPDGDVLCASQSCSRLFMAQLNGSFVEKTDTNLARHSLYSNPEAPESYLARPYVGDLNGDGMNDVIVEGGVYLSRGDGNFDSGGDLYGLGCERLLDLNGDGRADCLFTYPNGTAKDQYAYVANGTNNLLPTSNFNLNTPGLELRGLVPGSKVANLGFITADIDGDGRSDILRWSDDPARNAVFLSNGDGTFRNGAFNLTSGNDTLQKSDGAFAFVTGDFSGRGTLEILRLSGNAGVGAANVLYEKRDATPLDQLSSAVSATGLRTTLKWVPLPNSYVAPYGERYFHDFGSSELGAKYPLRDLIMPMQVVATTTSDTGVGAKQLVTEYLYAGLKIAYDGRGWLGFREMRAQTPTVNGKFLTVLTVHEQDGVNTGAAVLSRTWVGDLRGSNSPQVVANRFNIYCDKTAPPGAEANANTGHPCFSKARVRRPYLYMSVDEGWELNGTMLPTVSTVNSFNDSGDAERIVNTTQGSALGQNQIFTKTTENTYFPNSVAGDAWILGRLKTAKVGAENRVKGPAAALRQQAAATRFGKINEVELVTAKEVQQRTSNAGAATDNITRTATVPGTAPYAGATKGVEFALKITPNPLKVFAAAPGLVAGNLAAAVGGGIAPYQYRWTLVKGARSAVSNNAIANPQVSATLALGDNITELWQLTVTDAANGVISQIVAVTLAVPAGPLAVKINPSPMRIDANDPGEAWGTLMAAPSGGIAPYTYQWSRVSGTRASLSDSTLANPVIKANLVAGDAFTEQWRVTVTDAAAKLITAAVNITFSAPAALAFPLPASRSVTANAAGLASAPMSVTPTGGRPPYTYSWLRTAGTRSTASAAAAHNPTISVAMTPGELFTESWQLTVSDTAKHTSAASIAITFNYPAAAIGLSFSPAPFRVQADDAGPASGVLSATASGGVPPYSYAWTRVSGSKTSLSNPAVANPTVSATLAIGEQISESWKLTVTDSAGKQFAATVPVAFSAPAALAVSIPAATRAANATAATGGVASAAVSAANVVVSGGRAPYSYQWERSRGSRSSASNSGIENPVLSATLALGESIVEDWTLTVRDAAKHSAAAATVVTFAYPATALTITFEPAELLLQATDPGRVEGSVLATVKGGIPPYTYSWTASAGMISSVSNATVANPTISATLAAGQTKAESWLLTVKDSAGKSAADRLAVTMRAPSPLTVRNAVLPEAQDATAATQGVSSSVGQAAPTGGTGGNTFKWTRVSGTRSIALNDQAITPRIQATLLLGERLSETWEVLVTDSAGHTARVQAPITFAYPGAKLSAAFTPPKLDVDLNDPGTAAGTMTVNVAGGAPPYRYGWTGPAKPRGVLSNASIPNPTLTMTLGVGESVAEVWTVAISDAFGSKLAASIRAEFTTPAAMAVTLAAKATAVATAAGNGVASLRIGATPSGGRPPYTYAWSRVSGGRSSSANPTLSNVVIAANLILGESIVETWQVSVKDTVGHSASANTDITFNYPGEPLTIRFTPSGFGQVANPGPTSGVLTALVGGGVAPYRYAWTHNSANPTTMSDPTSATPTISANLAYGQVMSDTWNLKVTDTFGTTMSAGTTVSFSTPAKLTVSVPARAGTIPTAGTGSGAITQVVTVAGGRAPYNYVWTRLAGNRSTISNAAVEDPVFTAQLANGETVVETWQLEVRDFYNHLATGSNTITFKRAAAKTAGDSGGDVVPPEEAAPAAAPPARPAGAAAEVGK
ncbi:FG-GAP-like repeat-containing protein [Rugamonas sp. CCM 8940]|uniref:FG-GAP-like repeat-containing protein n=1 Tax=Rugamonas sp. CCM 8940 TaxID=2765359 RepID=UPI0018F5689E|nr:FG-GAP-like repeat-containing protein [Rugamonas sp. CCM 8940]MBJ7310405.1 VCBS repeat-containing protein [Rugamonas sp. CCM 8940]